MTTADRLFEEHVAVLNGRMHPETDFEQLGRMLMASALRAADATGEALKRDGSSEVTLALRITTENGLACCVCTREGDIARESVESSVDPENKPRGPIIICRGSCCPGLPW